MFVSCPLLHTSDLYGGVQRAAASSEYLEGCVEEDVQREMRKFDRQAAKDGREDTEELQTERENLRQAVMAYRQFFNNVESVGTTGVLNGRKAIQQWTQADFKRHYISEAAKMMVRS